jgi:hypothetical protein
MTNRRAAVMVALVAMVPCCSSAPSSPDACVTADNGLPLDVFCTGLYLRHDSSKINSEALPYSPGVVLWSDGADKQRYLYLPPQTVITSDNMDAWKFPVGTKAWKEFRVDGALVETRLLWKSDTTTWQLGTYVWNTDGDATLNASPKGTVLPNGYEIPGTKDCDKCHHGGSDKLLGIEAVALALPSARGVTLTTLAQDYRLSKAPTRTTIDLPNPALGFLHANCGMPCHSSRGLGEETKLVLRLRSSEFWPDGSTYAPVAVAMTDIYQSSVGQPPTTASVAAAFPGANRIVPGAHDMSLLWLLSHRRGNYQMPPLVSHRIDDVGTQQLAAWIDALTP